jgi:predicted flap endonuclease-1-like 5' DNA nuclease
MSSVVQSSFWLALSRKAKQRFAELKPRPNGSSLTEDSPPLPQALAIAAPHLEAVANAEQAVEPKVPTFEKLESKILGLKPIPKADPPAPIRAAPRPDYPISLDPKESDFSSVFRLKDVQPPLAPAHPVQMPKTREDVPPAMGTLHQNLSDMADSLAELGRMAPVLDTEAARRAGVVIKGKHELQVIKGIGPKMSAWLESTGIRTLADLADASEARLQQGLRLAGPHHRLVKPESWIRQADLAALNQWQALKDMQNAMKTRKRRASL